MSDDQPISKIALFKGKKIRKTFHENEWWFSIIDVVEVLTDSKNSRDYWYRMKIRVSLRREVKFRFTEVIVLMPLIF